jgi:hypothetical protein
MRKSTLPQKIFFKKNKALRYFVGLAEFFGLESFCGRNTLFARQFTPVVG